MKDLLGKVAIVTGASRGIGRATALHLGARGAAVVVNYAKRAQEAQAVVSAIEDNAGKAMCCQADIGKLAEIDRLINETVARFKRLDIFVANAGVSIFGPLAEVSEADFDRQFAVNTKGTFFCLQAASKQIADNGRIVCISTIGTELNLPNGASYFGSKAAVEQFCRILAKEIAPRGVTVNIVSPGFTDTDMLESTGGNEPENNVDILRMTPLARLGRAEEIAQTIGFLVGAHGGWVNRQNIAADGGIISR